MDRRELRKERRRDQARDEILEAAARVLLERGLSGFKLLAVARELQLTKAALYYYFDSKEALVFELLFISHDKQAAAISAAVGATASGEAAMAALIRSTSEHFGDRKDDLRLIYLVPQVGGTMRLDAEMIQRLRPFNDRIYGAVASKISADQRADRIDTGIDGRRLAFLAHTSVLGMLMIEGLVEAAKDGPLIHSREAMTEELVSTFCARLTARA